MGKINYSKIMAIFIAVIMVLSVLGYVGGSLASESKKIEYNGYSFVQNGNMWRLIEYEDYYFQYLPDELENVSTPPLTYLSSNKIYLGFKPNDNISVGNSMSSVSYLLYSKNIIPQEACTIEEGCPDIPIIDCESNQGIIMISGNSNTYSQNEKCLIITATDTQELSRLTERFIYQQLGVIG
jgi:hypothetical protein